MPKQIVIDDAALRALLAAYTDMDTESQKVLGPYSWQGPGGTVNGDLSSAFPIRLGNGSWDSASTLSKALDALRGAINERLKAYGTNIRTLHYGINNLITTSDATESLNKLTASDFTSALPQQGS